MELRPRCASDDSFSNQCSLGTSSLISNMDRLHLCFSCGLGAYAALDCFTWMLQFKIGRRPSGMA